MRLALIISYFILGFQALAFAGDAPSFSFPRNFVDKPFLYSPEVALKQYIGTWEGNVITSTLDGRIIADIFVVQTYSKNLNGSLNCNVEAFSRGYKVIEKKSRIYIEENYLVLEMKNGNGKFSPAYIGRPSFGKVVWSPFLSFLLFDQQIDNFEFQGKDVEMRSMGFKHENIPQISYTGILFSEGIFKKLLPKKTEPIKNLRLDKNYFKN